MNPKRMLPKNITISLFRNRCLLFLLLIFSSSLFAQNNQYKSQGVVDLEQQIYKLSNQEKYLEARQLIRDYSLNDDLKPIDHYFLHLNLSYIHKRIYNYDKVLKELEIANGYGLTSQAPDYTRVNIMYQKALAYFDTQEFEQSKAYMERISKDVDVHLSIGDLGYYYMQLGYLKFQDQQYLVADSLFHVSVNNIKENNPCHLPVILTKQMELYYHLGDFEKKRATENRALQIADSCGIRKYAMLTYDVARQLAEKFENYEEYYHYSRAFIDIKNTYPKEGVMVALEQLESKYLSQAQEEILLLTQKNNKQLAWLLLLSLGLIGLVLILFVKARRNRGILMKSNEELNALDALNKQIFMMISHDFKEPLLGFQFLLDELKKGKSGIELQEDIGHQISQTALVLKNLTDWAASELEFNDSQKQSNISEEFSLVLDELEESIKRKKLNIAFDIPSNVSLELSKDILRITLRNLLSNAIKYSNEGGIIVLEWDDNSLKVKDEGKGLPENLKEALFKEKVKSAYGTFNENGFGIGLYITSAILKKKGFEIRATNNKAGGACFEILKI